MTVEKIVEEVIRRLQALMNRQHLLIVFHSKTDIKRLESFLETVKQPELKVGVISFKEPGQLLDLLGELELEVINLIDHRDHLDMAYLMARYDSVCLTGCSIGEMHHLSTFNVQTPLEELMLDCLMAKGKIYAIPTYTLTPKYKEELISGVEKLYDTLEGLGVQWIGRRTTGRSELSGVITCSQLAEHNNGRVVLSTESVLTPLAREYAETHQIKLVRK